MPNLCSATQESLIVTTEVATPTLYALRLQATETAAYERQLLNGWMDRMDINAFHRSSANRYFSR